jgi:trk system potassium uptake protein TrkA
VGIESIVSPKHATVGQILRFVRSLAASGASDSEIEALYRVMDGDIEALEFAVKESIEGITDIPLKDINKKSNTIIACIVHGDEIIIPGGKDVISKGDTVIVFTQSEKMKSIKDII